jgi:rubrerythrin
MADNPSTINVLNELLAAHKRSLLLRVMETSPFVSSADAALADTLRHIIAEEAEHADWLVEAVVEREGSPVSAIPDPRTASVHYVDLRYLLARIVQDERRILRACEAAAERIEDPAARELITRIAERHRRHLDALGAAVPVPA